MPYYLYVGHSVGTIHSFAYVYRYTPGYTIPPEQVEAVRKRIEQDEAELKKIFEGKVARYLLAITADLYQYNSHPMLKAAGFSQVIRFQSTHTIKAEVLTLWVKENSEIPEYSEGKEPKKEPFPANCSVKCNIEKVADGEWEPNMFLMLTQPVDAAFKKVDGLPIWYKVKEGKVVNKKV